MFDRLRLMHSASRLLPASSDDGGRERAMLTGLQLGLRQIRLRELLETGKLHRETTAEVRAAFRAFHRLVRHPERVRQSLHTLYERLQARLLTANVAHATELQALAELREMSRLIDAGAPLAAPAPPESPALSYV